MKIEKENIDIFEGNFNFRSLSEEENKTRAFTMRNYLGRYLQGKGFVKADDKYSQQEDPESRFVFYRHPNKYCVELDLSKKAEGLEGSFLIRAKNGQKADEVFNWNAFENFIKKGF